MKFERLGENIKQVRGISYKPNDISAIPLPDYVPVLKANNIQERGIDTTDLIYIHKSKVKPEQFIKKGDLLLAASSGSKEIVGKNIFFENDFEGSFGAFCKLVRPMQSIHPKFVGVFFKTPYFKRHIRNLINGALINNLKNEHIDSLLIPTLSHSDQLHIASILSKAENLISQRKESIRLLDEFLKSTFLEMFGDAVKNEKKWNKSELKNYAKVRIGPFGSLLHREDYVQNGVPLVNPSHIGEGKIFIDPDLTISKSKMKELSAYVMHEDDVVLGRRGEIGRCAVVTKKEEGYLCGTGSIYIRPTDELNPIFLYNIISSDSMRKVLEKSAKGITMKNLNSGIIENLKIPVPPIEIQTKFAQIVEKTETLKTQYQKSLQELENLYGSLSQKAFRGELASKKNEAKVVTLTPETKPVQTKLTKQQAFLRKLMLASHIIHEMCDEPTFGHTKLMKLLYISEQAGGMALQTNYKKFAAGPFDGKTLTLIDKEFVKNKWFAIEKKSFTIGGQKREATLYKKTEKSLLYKKHFDNYFESEAETINKIIALFRKEKTQTAEIVATLYFAWKELITSNTMISEDSLVKGFYQFHKEKRKFTKEQILIGYEYMQTNELYPQ